jgi:hypothetical protein
MYDDVGTDLNVDHVLELGLLLVEREFDVEQHVDNDEQDEDDLGDEIEQALQDLESELAHVDVGQELVDLLARVAELLGELEDAAEGVIELLHVGVGIADDGLDGEADDEDQNGEEEEDEEKAHQDGSPARNAGLLAIAATSHRERFDERREDEDEEAREHEGHENEGELDEHHPQSVNADHEEGNGRDGLAHLRPPLCRAMSSSHSTLSSSLLPLFGSHLR